MSKNIIRVQKDKDNPYVIMNKNFLSDNNLSWKAKGILSYLLSKPDDWKVVIKDLISQSPDGKSSVEAGMKELKKYNYIKKIPIRKHGKFSHWETIIHEYPQTELNTPLPENQEMVKDAKIHHSRKIQSLVFPELENQPLLYNDLTNNDLTNNNNLSIYHKNENDGLIDYKKIIAENISYDSLKIDFDNDSIIDNIFHIVVDVVESTGANIKINGNYKPLETVKSTFLKLNENHIKYFVESYQDNAKPIKYIKSYIITSLYNAYHTMDLHYKNKIKEIYNE